MDMKEASSGKSWVSTSEIYVNLVTVCIGAGILALPQLPVRCGYILASLCLALAGLGVHEACLQLWRGLRQCGASTFEALGYEALGHTGRVLAGVMVNLFLLGICSAYAALVGTQLHNLTGLWSPRSWIVSASPVFLFLALLPNLALLSKLVPLGMLAAALTAVVAIWRSLKDAAVWQSWDERIHNAWPLEPMALGSAVSISLGAFSISVVVPALVGDMRKPEHFPRALLGAILSCGGLYLGVMLCGYYGYGNFISNDLVISMTRSPASYEQAMSNPDSWTGIHRAWLRVFVSTLILINIILSMPLLAMSVFYSIESLESAKQHLAPNSWANRTMRVLIIAGVVLVALAVPRFTVIFGFFAALTVPCVSLILPLVFAGRLVDMSRWRRCYHAALILLGVLGMVFGIYTSVLDVLSG